MSEAGSAAGGDDPSCDVVVTLQMVHSMTDAALVPCIKSLQRQFNDFSPFWRNFCVSNGSTVFDPGRHDAVFLRSFLEARTRDLHRRCEQLLNNS